eukprot:jgi/Sobl393_1/5288/SZX73809.1
MLNAYQQLQPTIWWGMVTPSFCITGACAPWFGSDWGWSSGWDWASGTWAANSDRGCVTQGGSQLWGAYAGIDTHYPSYMIWSAVEMAVTKGNSSGEPNSGVWISVL